MAFEWCPGTVARFRSGFLFSHPSTTNPVGKYCTELFLGAVVLCSASFSSLVIPRDALHFGTAGSQTTLRDSQPAGQWVQEDSVAGPLILERRPVARQNRSVMEKATGAVHGKAPLLPAHAKRTPTVQIGALDLQVARRIDQPAGPRTQESSVGGPLTLSQLYVALNKVPAADKTTGIISGKVAPEPLVGASIPATGKVADTEAQPGTEPEQLAKIQSPPAAEKILEIIPRPYIDQLIDPESAGREIDKEYRLELEQSQGRRFLSAQFLHYQQDQDRFGTSMEDGVRLRWNRETLNFGELEMKAALRSDRPASQRGQDGSVGGQLTLSQHGLALTSGWTMDSVAGVIRSKADTDLSSSFRINLPTSLMGGVRTHIFSENQELRLNVGRIGRLGTGQIQDFESDEAWLASAGYGQNLNPLWRAGFHVVSLQDSNTVEDHQSAAGLVEYLSLDRRHRYQAHTLVDSDGNYGVWLDADDRVGRWRHRYGMFYLQPDLLWTDSQIPNDEQGFYTRSQLRRLRYFLSTGFDYRDTNINDDPDITSTRTLNGFASGTWRYRRRSSLGGTLSMRDVQSRENSDDTGSREVRLTSFISQRFGFGTTRLQGSLARLQRGSDDGYGYAVDLDQNWVVSRFLQISGTLSREVTRNIQDDEERNSASILFLHSYSSRLRWNGDFTFTRLNRNSQGNQDSINASASLFWHFQRNWDAVLRVVWNRTDNAPGSGLDPDSAENEKTLLLSLQYAKSSGRPFEIMGLAGDASGYGEVSGLIFFDENTDGERQAGEAVAPGVVILLDGRYERITNKQGEFDFVPVPAGEHKISLLVEDLPLPWGLEDETPRIIQVPVRGHAIIDFSLVRIDQQLALSY